MAVAEQVDAKKTRFRAADALRLARAAARVIVAKGKKLTVFDMQADPPDDDTLLKHLLGPTGNLRAPAIRADKTLLVGFNNGAYDEVL